MIERLVEYWLNSASERSYQAAFVQMLVAEGHRVLHSTRHAPIEFGKDIISVAPDGVPCAYQLKGNPGGRLTLAQFRDMKGQIQELVTQPIPLPGLPPDQHRSYLVTNGWIEEEVQRSIGDMNVTWARQRFPKDALEIIQKGDLLGKATKLGAALWPTEVADLGALVDLLSHRGDDILPAEKMHRLLTSMYRLAGPDAEKVPTGNELQRLVTSAALLVAVATRNFAGAGNHFAIVSAWVLFGTYTIAACTRAGLTAVDGILAESMAAARQAIFEAIGALVDELANRPNIIEGRPLSDPEFQGARRALLNGLLSTYWLWCRRDRLEPANLATVERILPREWAPHGLWGEAVVPQFLAHYWYMSRRDGGFGPEVDLARLLAFIVQTQLSGDEIRYLAAPHYTIADVVRHNTAEFLGPGNDPYDAASFRDASHFVEGLLHLVVRTNLKQTCKFIWPSVTRLTLRSFEVEEPWQFCTIHSDHGLNCMKIPEPTGHWSALQAEAASCDTPKVPPLIRADPILLLLLLYSFIVPQRATPDVIRFLGGEFSDVWFLPQPR